MQGGALLAAPFDMERLEVRGHPTPVLKGVMWSPTGGMAQFALSREGSLIYIPGGAVGEEPRSLLWVDRQGKALPVTEERRAFGNWPALSPDGKRIALSISRSGNPDIWIYEIARRALTRITYSPGNEFRPIWLPDGARLAYYYAQARPVNLFWISVDASGESERLLKGQYDQRVGSCSPDGKMLVFGEDHPLTRRDLWVLPLEGERKAWPFLNTSFNEDEAAVSPDGRWLAYASDESGRYEIYVQSFPKSGRKRQISTEGGNFPRWSRNGRELFFRNGAKLMAVSIETQPELTTGQPRFLFEGPYLEGYDLAPDGQRFLMVEAPEKPLPQINVVLNWFEELKRR